MRFVFKTTAYGFDLAAEQEILLRHESNRKKAWLASLGLSALLVVLCVVLVLTKYGDAEAVSHFSFIIVGILLTQQAWQDYSGGNIRGLLKMLYRGRDPWGGEDFEMSLAVEGDTIYVYRGEEEVGTWDCSMLRAVTESEMIFDLQRGGLNKSYLAIPKDSLVEGDIDAFREHMRGRIHGKQEVRFYAISEKRQAQLAAAKARLFPKY